MSLLTPSAAEPGVGGERSAAIRLAGVTKRFGSTVAVDALDLEIPEGSFFALLGPSGCGKTTTLRMVGGFEEPTAGTVWLGGEDVTDRPPYRRDVNTVFQSYALFPHLDVERNVAFGLERRKVGRDEVRRRVAEALELTQLGGLGKRRPAQLSGGQQQRVALARALVNRPRALLLDEPLGALDLRLRKQLQLELKRIQREVGITFVHVTHDQEEAMTMADEIAVMREGRVEQRGDAETLYERPRTAFVANFLGESNLLDATVLGTDGRLAVVEAEGGVRLRVPADRVPSGARDVRIGVRPEKLAVEPDADPDADADAASRNALRGRVTEASYLGVSLRHLVAVRDGEEITVLTQNTDGRAHDATAPGREVRLTWAPEHTFIVDMEVSR